MQLHFQGFALSVMVVLGFAAVSQAPAQAAAAADSDQTAISLEALSRLKDIDLEANPAVKGVVLKVLNQVRGTPQFLDIVRDFHLQGQEPGLLELALKGPSSQAGVEAARMLLNGGKPELLSGALASTDASGIVEALGHSGEKSIVPLLEPIVADSTRELMTRKQALRALCNVKEGAASILELARTQKLADDLKFTATTELNAVRWADLKAEAERLLPMPQAHDSKPLPAVSDLVKLPGDRAHGAAVFRSETVGCSKCHQVNGVGTDFGPNLSEIGTKLAKEALYEAILDPSAGISFGFEAWQLELKNGDEAYGLITSETAEELAVKAVGGVITRYRKADISKRVQQKLSIMPAGLEKTMSTQDLVDLVEYLSSLKKSPQ